MSSRPSRLVLALVAVAAIGAATADEIVVSVESLVIRSGKGSMYPPVAQAQKSERIEVIDREPDKWLKVRYDGREGFVRETALVPRGSSQLSEAVRGAGALTGTSTDIGASAAARGVGEDAAVYAHGKGMSTAGLEAMIASRDRVAGERWIAFVEQGKVGPAKQ